MTKAIASRCLANVLYIPQASERTPDSGFMAVMVQAGPYGLVDAWDLNCPVHSGGKSAVHGDRSAGDVAAAVAGQMRDRPGDVLRRAVAAERRDAAQRARRRAVSGIHVGVDEAAV